MEAKKVFLLPGELSISQSPQEITTILGSCVAVCLFNQDLKIGGMNHFMLANTPPGQVPSAKYGDYAIETLAAMMVSYDKNIKNIAASVIGGGNVVGHLNFGIDVGTANVLIAEELLKKYRIRIVKMHTGGTFGRKVFFKTHTGELEIKIIDRLASLAQAEPEKTAEGGIKNKIRVLVVDDSVTVRSLITEVISADPDIEVVGEAADAYEARRMVLELDPDVICLDIIMPKIDGITFLKKLFLYRPKAVIIISTIAQEGSLMREQARKIGAIDVIDKSTLDIYSGSKLAQTILTTKIKAAQVAWLKIKDKKK